MLSEATRNKLNSPDIRIRLLEGAFKCPNRHYEGVHFVIIVHR